MHQTRARPPAPTSNPHIPTPLFTGRRRVAWSALCISVGLASLCQTTAGHAQSAVSPAQDVAKTITPSGTRAEVQEEVPLELQALIDGPAPPVPPATVARDARGRSTVRAIRLAAGLRLDGHLDEPVYAEVPAITDFIQGMPLEGVPATERTEAWIMFHDESLFVGARIWDAAPPSQWVAREMRRDAAQLRDDDSFWVLLDTFYDRRNAVAFFTNPLGGIGDFAITNEGNPNGDWNPVWDVRTGRFDTGWTIEIEIPFKSLRYRPGPSQVWGIQLRRTQRLKNEWTYLSPVPLAAGRAAVFRVSDYATLVGVQTPEEGRTFELKPYGIAGVTTDRTANPPTRNAGAGDVGLDVKYGITQNLTADLTYNTDFAQVEVDEQQVNLTRFSLFFPEKREFFLEGRGIFEFAKGVSLDRRKSALRQFGDMTTGFWGGENTPTVFYSRRIGLEGGVVVPIVGGGRLTGKVGPFDVGTLNIQTEDEPISRTESTNFTVVRVKRDILRRSSVGAILTNRSVSTVGPGSSQAYGADATFSFYDNVSLLTYLARTETPGLDGEDLSYQGQFIYNGDRYGLQAEHLLVGNNFLPDVGFLRRNDFRRSYGEARFSPRPRSLESIRQFRLEGSFDYTVAAHSGQLETRQAQVGFNTEWESSDQVGISVVDNYEFLPEPFGPAPGVVFAPGSYSFVDVEGTYLLGAQHRFSGLFTVRIGEYFNGNIRSVGFSRARLGLTPRLSLEPTVSVNWIDTPQGSFRSDLLVSRATYTFTPRMFFSGLVQYNSASNTVSNNLRLRWEFRPGSELFVVYTEDRETNPLRPDRYSDLRNRGLVIKVNRLFRF